MEKYEIVIIGAGPAGLRAARVLAENGKEVLVLEKNRVIGPTICAGGLTIKDIDIIPKNIVDKTFIPLPNLTTQRAFVNFLFL